MSSEDLDNPDKHRLIKELAGYLERPGDDIPTTVWACLWLADISALERYVDSIKERWKRGFPADSTLEGENLAKIISHCKL